MKSVTLWTLVVVNCLLAGALGLTLLPDNTAHAQNRRTGDYIMIPGDVAGESAAVVFVIDSANGQLGGIAYDDNDKQMKTMPPIDLGRVFDQAMREQDSTRRRSR